jgi:hypothetical protein
VTPVPDEAAQDLWRYVIAGGVVLLVLLSIRLAMWRSRWTAVAMLASGLGLAIAFATAL